MRRIRARYELVPSSLFRTQKHHSLQATGCDESTQDLEGRFKSLEKRLEKLHRALAKRG